MPKKCKHNNWIPAGYRHNESTIRVQSMYHTYCKDCKKFINILTGKELEDEDLVAIKVVCEVIATNKKK